MSPGLALEPALVFVPVKAGAPSSARPEEERLAFERAVAEAIEQVGQIAVRLREEGGEEDAGILEAQALMLQDPTFHNAVVERVTSGLPAARAVQDTASDLEALFEALDDPYLAARAADVQDIADRVCRNLTGRQEIIATHPCVLVAHDLAPSQTATLDRQLVRGFVLEVGGPTSHTAILARSLGIPAVVGVGPITSRVRSGDTIAMDGQAGLVILQPGDAERTSFQARTRNSETTRQRRPPVRDLPAETRDGRRVILAANIGSLEDLPLAHESGAEGVGLFRTEFLFAGRSAVPTEEEQVEVYAAVLEAMTGHTVVIRTLDIGGDKPLPYLPMPKEDNPFLGMRGIRHALAQPDLFRSQLRALLRASPQGRLAIMFPMISGLEEVRTGRELVRTVQQEVGGSAEVGVMIEVPSAALLAEALAERVEFASVGSNDLVQYTLAVDRMNERVARLYQPLHPAVLRLLASTVEGMHRHGRWAGICGEMAGDELAVPLLLGLGFDELSVAPGRISAVKEQIRALTASACERLVRQALTCSSVDEIEELVRPHAS